MKKLLIIGFFSAIFLLSLTLWVNADRKTLQDSVLRLHVIANSNTKQDQAVKLLVRDCILTVSDTLFADCSTREAAYNAAATATEHFTAIANDVLKKNGFPYKAFCTLREEKFPTKHYGNIALPAGTYLSLNIRLGKAEGDNWWCVLYPPLCFTGATVDEAVLKETLSAKDYTLISEGSDGSLPIRFKFKLFEIFSQ